MEKISSCLYKFPVGFVIFSGLAVHMYCIVAHTAKHLTLVSGQLAAPNGTQDAKTIGHRRLDVDVWTQTFGRTGLHALTVVRKKCSTQNCVTQMLERWHLHVINPITNGPDEVHKLTFAKFVHLSRK